MIVKEKKGGQFFDLINGDCLIEMQNIPDNSIDAIITDPPYGTTECKWDAVIDFDLMWQQLNRIIKPNGAIILFGSEPFSSALRISNIKMFRYDWIWDKNNGANFAQVKKQPLKVHEIISVFYAKQPDYTPKLKGGTLKSYGKRVYQDSEVAANNSNAKQGIGYPKSILYFPRVSNLVDGYFGHPTQKPLKLMEYLIETYTQENETVLDFTMGSGSTGVACKNTNRNFIGIEKDEKYFNIAVSRIKGTESKTKLADKPKAGGLFSFTDDTHKAY